jgi:hypothetical protein
LQREDAERRRRIEASKRQWTPAPTITTTTTATTITNQAFVPEPDSTASTAPETLNSDSSSIHSSSSTLKVIVYLDEFIRAIHKCRYNLMGERVKDFVNLLLNFLAIVLLKKNKFEFFQASVSEKGIYPIKELSKMADQRIKRPLSPPPPIPSGPRMDVFRPSAPPPPPDLIHGKGSYKFRNTIPKLNSLGVQFLSSIV